MLKIGDKTLSQKNQQTIVLERGEEEFNITVTALPPGWMDHMRSLGMLEFPAVPKKPLRDPRTKKHVINTLTGQIETVEDTEDTEYVRKCAVINRRFIAVKLAECLRGDPKVTFGVERPTTDFRDDWQKYGDNLTEVVYHEECGLTDREINNILRVADRLESKIDIDKAIDDFLVE